MYRRTISFPQVLLVALAPHLAQGFLHKGVRKGFTGPIDPDAVFLAQGCIATDWAQGDLFARSFGFEGISGCKLQLLAQRLREDDPARLVEGESYRHIAIIQWYFPFT